MSVKVFILGRPGSGKSAAARCITELAQRKDCPAIHISDYEILHGWFLSEKHNPYIEHRYFCPTEHYGFDVIDFSILNKALEKVKEIVQEDKSPNKTLALIEFARSDYSEVLRIFSDEVLHDAYFLYVDSDIDTCIQRVHARTIRPRTINDHYVPEYIIKSYYQKDNEPYIRSQLAEDYKLDKGRVKIIDNTRASLKFFTEIARFVENILQQEMDVSKETEHLPKISLSVPINDPNHKVHGSQDTEPIHMPTTVDELTES